VSLVRQIDVDTNDLDQVSPGPARPRWRPLHLAVLAALLACAGLIVWAGIFHAPMNYDEGYNLQIPVNLAAKGLYATDGALHGGHVTPFDVYISTGPTVLLPVAGLFALFGPHLWLARLVPTSGYLMLLLGGWRTGSRLSGRVGGLAVLAAILGVNAMADWPVSSVPGTGAVLGEYSSAAFLLWAAAFISNRPRLAGVLIGLATLTKLVAGLALPGFVLAVFLVRGRQAWRDSTKTSARLVSGALLPLLAWQLVEVAVLGPDGYRRHVYDFMLFFSGAGSGLAGGRSGGLPSRLLSLSQTLNGPAWLLSARRRLVGLGSRSSLPGDRATTYETLAAMYVTSVGSVVWWLFMEGQSWVRHLIPALMLAVTAVTVTAVLLLRPWMLSDRRGGTVVCLLLAAWLAVPVVARAHDAVHPPGQSLAEQQQAATALRRLNQQPHHDGWGQNPELMFLAGRVSRPLSARGGLLVVSDMYLEVSPPDRAVLNRCGTEVRHVDGYQFCQVPPRG
jgi:hypothetical protein